VVIVILKLGTPVAIHWIFSLEGPVSVIIDPNQDYIATHDNSGLLQLWDSNLRILPHQLKAEIEDISFSPTAILRTDLGGHSPIIKQLSVIGMGFKLKSAPTQTGQ
jgi:hypothetical protein